MNDVAPEYLYELESIRKSSRNLGSSNQILLQVPISRLKSCGVIWYLVLQPPLCGIGCWQILEIRRIFKKFNLF